MWIFPLGAAVVALVFAGALVRAFLRRRRTYQALWAVALLMYAAASLALFLGVLQGWTTAEFRVYWLFGAILNVPFLAMGEVDLLVRNRAVTGALLVVVLFLSAFALARVRTASIDVAALHKSLPLGKDVFARDTLPYRLSQLYAYPAYVGLLLGMGWSIWQMRSVPSARERMIGTSLIAAGATVVAIGSGVGAGFDVVPVFSIGLLAGIAIMFWGFIRVSAPPRSTHAPIERPA